MRSAELSGLLERVKASKGRDEDLDADLMIGLGVLTRWNVMAEWPDEPPIWEYREDTGTERVSGRHHPMVPRLTASIDAALALVERKLPGAGVLMDTRDDGFVMVYVRPNINNPIDGKMHKTPPWCGDVREYGTPLPLAILAALLLALIQKESDDAGA